QRHGQESIADDDFEPRSPLPKRGEANLCDRGDGNEQHLEPWSLQQGAKSPEHVPQLEEVVEQTEEDESEHRRGERQNERPQQRQNSRSREREGILANPRRGVGERYADWRPTRGRTIGRQLKSLRRRQRRHGPSLFLNEAQQFPSTARSLKPSRL